MKILLQYQMESYVWGRRERVSSFTKTVGAGEHFWIWETAEENGAVRFSVAEPFGFERYEGEGFLLHAGERRPFRGVKNSVCAEDCLEDVVTGMAEIVFEETTA